MNNQHLTLAHWLTQGHSPISIQELATLMAEPGVHHLFIKDKQFKYVYANTPFVTLMGLKHINQLIGHQDSGLCSDKSLNARYRMYDAMVLEQETVLALSDEVRPKHNSHYSHAMEGKEYPLYVNSDKPNFVLGIVTSKTKLQRLDWNTLFTLEQAALNNLLINKFYSVQTAFGLVRFSKRELQVFIALLKGYHAGETAQHLQLKQTTVESYLVNIRNKTGTASKSELINFAIRFNLLEQIVL